MSKKEIEEFAGQEYKFGFKTEIDSLVAPKGLSEDTIKLISLAQSSPTCFSNAL